MLSCTSSIHLNNIGLKSYEQALQVQMDILNSVVSGNVDQLIICSHPPVVTLGRASTPSDIAGWTGQTVKVSRGGRATYHGPNQVIVYPILNLNIEGRKNLRKRDLHQFLRLLEASVVNTLNLFNILAEVKTTEVIDNTGKKLSLTGVWVGEKKIASIGVAVKKWVTYHGVAINLYHDSNAFKGINPCGFSTDLMTDVESVLGKKIDRQKFETVLAKELIKVFT